MRSDEAAVHEEREAGGGFDAARVEELTAWLREYARTRLQSRLIDERRSIPPYVVLDLGNRGLLGMQVAREHGGLGLGHRESVRIAEELGSIDLMLAVFVGNNNSLGIRPIDRFGRPERRAELLPMLAAGRGLAAFALTEAGAGSNPRAIATRATRGSDGRFRIDGKKIWSGSASWAAVINVFAQTYGAAGERLGITGFVLDQHRRGVRAGPEALTLGMRGMVQSTVLLDDVVAEPADVLGEVGGGLDVAQEAMTYCRMGLAAIAVGGMKRCVQLLGRYATRRRVGTGRLIDNPVLRLRLAEVAAKTLALRCLVDAVAERLDDGRIVPVEAFCACKTLGAEFLWQAADWLVQGLGGRGYMENNPAGRLLRDARVFRIFEGPTETIQMFLGSRLLAGRRSPETLTAAAGGDGWVTARLARAADVLHERARRRPFEKRIWSSEYACFVGGEVYAWGLLAAAVRERAATLPREAADGLVGWVERELASRCDRLAADDEPGALLAAPFADAVAATVGDVEQRLAGEEAELDPLLDREQARDGE